MKYNIVTIGDASEDIFIRPTGVQIVPEGRYLSGKSVTFELGEKIPIESVWYDVGGSACNTAVSFSRFGYNVSTIVATGIDSPFEKILRRLKEESVDTSLIISNKKTATNFSVVFNITEERTIFVYHGLDDYSVLAPKKSLKTSWIYLGPMGENTKEVENRLVSMISEKGVKLAWNPGMIQIEEHAQSFRPLLKNTKILFLNREEGLKFCHFPVKAEPREIMRTLHAFGPEIIVLTDGKRGAFCYDGGVYYRIDAMNQDRVDATGAGDSFSSAFTARIVEAGERKEDNMRDIISDALKWGIINSTSVVNKIGAQTGLLTKHQIEEEMRKNPRLVVEIY